jgi:hypothetical protein
MKRYLSGRSAEGAKLLRGFVRLVRECGPVTVEPLKTRVGFKARMTFAAASVSGKALEAHVVLPRRLDHPRFTKIERFGASHVHSFRIERLEELDDEVGAWLCEAFREGAQAPASRRLPSSRTFARGRGRTHGRTDRPRPK